jgi:transmembrane sensor
MTRANRIEAAAARWVARREAGTLEPHDAAAFEAWCAEDPRHLGALVRLEAVNASLGRVAALQGIEPDAKGFKRYWIPAAAAALVAGVMGLRQMSQPPASPADNRIIATRLGEQYRTALKDGSLVELNTASRIAIDLEPKERRIRLVAGEAAFEVVKDPQRPFIVDTALGTVRAIGTVFSVRVDHGLEVLVSEGVVSVERNGKQVALVSAGERYSITSSGNALRSSRNPDEIKRSLVWREGKLAFAGQTLGQAAQEFNRYNVVRIEIADPIVGAMRFGGYFRATDPQGFASALEKSLPVNAERQGDTITLRQR